MPLSEKQGVGSSILPLATFLAKVTIVKHNMIEMKDINFIKGLVVSILILLVVTFSNNQIFNYLPVFNANCPESLSSAILKLEIYKLDLSNKHFIESVSFDDTLIPDGSCKDKVIGSNYGQSENLRFVKNLELVLNNFSIQDKIIYSFYTIMPFLFGGLVLLNFKKKFLITSFLIFYVLFIFTSYINLSALLLEKNYKNIYEEITSTNEILRSKNIIDNELLDKRKFESFLDVTFLEEQPCSLNLNPVLSFKTVLQLNNNQKEEVKFETSLSTDTIVLRIDNYRIFDTYKAILSENEEIHLIGCDNP